MFLLATLGRLDIWPTGDFGVRVGFAFGWNLPDVPSPKELDVLGEPFRPYRSLVAWYCWRAADDRTLVPTPALVVPT
jgi:3-methyladenine DNA glycosylase/8-oxoguanine DNA glycosylase